jgi:hypothetical protein
VCRAQFDGLTYIEHCQRKYAGRLLQPSIRLPSATGPIGRIDSPHVHRGPTVSFKGAGSR